MKTYEVIPRPDAMAQQSVHSDAIVDALQSNNRNDGAGRIDQGEEALLVRVAGAIGNIEDIGNILVQNKPWG